MWLIQDAVGFPLASHAFTHATTTAQTALPHLPLSNHLPFILQDLAYAYIEDMLKNKAKFRMPLSKDIRNS